MGVGMKLGFVAPSHPGLGFAYGYIVFDTTS
jgi:hypothetical protein